MSCVMRRCFDLNCLLDQEPLGFFVYSLASCHLGKHSPTVLVVIPVSLLFRSGSYCLGEL